MGQDRTCSGIGPEKAATWHSQDGFTSRPPPRPFFLQSKKNNPVPALESKRLAVAAAVCGRLSKERSRFKSQKELLEEKVEQLLELINTEVDE